VHRIAALPRRDWQADAYHTALEMTAWLRTKGGSETLWPIQGVSLLEAGETNGLFCAGSVGCGKTLTAALLPIVLGAERPLLIVPGSLREGTRRAHAALRRHWRLPKHYRVESYECLALDKYRDLLEKYRPDAIICDEVHRLKRLRVSAAARRVRRWLEQAPETRFAGLTATPSEHGIRDYLHLILWALRDRAPVPADYDAQDQWAAALDPGVDSRPPLAALEVALGPLRDYEHAGQVFRARLEATPGIVVSRESWGEPGSLLLRGHLIDTPPALEPQWEQLRRFGVRADGYPLEDQRQIWGVATEYGAGFYYYPDPGPPQAWRDARKAWCAFVRDVLDGTDRIDTAFQVADYCSRGWLPADAWRAWAAIRDTYDPELYKRAAWLSSHVLEAAERWGCQRPGLIWCAHRAFGAELAKRTGWALYDGAGNPEAAEGHQSIILALKSNLEGKNLQHKWHRNLFVEVPTIASQWEQAIGRTHRPGQTADVVEVDYFSTCLESVVALHVARDRARAAIGAIQKLLLADHVPAKASAGGWAWGKR
jgi:hypothetical protein